MKKILSVFALTALVSAQLIAGPNKPSKSTAKASAPRAMPAEFLGVKLGSEFEIKECAVQTFPYGVSSVYDFSSSKNIFPCWHAPSPQSKDGRPKDDAFEVDIIPIQSPRGVGNVRLLVLQGLIEGLTYPTSGAESQDALMLALTEKFGPPTVTEIVEKQNAMGAKFAARTAAWTFTDGQAGFLGIGSRFDRGFGNIYTRAGAAHEESQREPKQSF